MDDNVKVSTHASAGTYVEDIAAGDSFALGEHEMVLADVEEFRQRWDPGTMHAVTPTPSPETDQPIASGIHSIAVQQRLAFLGVLYDWAVVAGRRLRQVTFDAPVRVGMTLTGELVVDEVLARSPRTGIVVFTVTLRHGDQVVLRVTHEAIVLRRDAATSG